MGFRKGRPENLQLGDQLDFWTVARVTTNRLTLSADMRLPGNAVFDIHVFENASGDVCLEHTVSFNPRGWIGHFYWFALYPLHALVFRKMLNNMAEQIEAEYAK